jgi:hypothetical protein
MSDDIVTRLRNWHDQRDSWQTLIEAANEIERLRAKANRFEDLLRTFDDYFVCEECEKYCATYLLDCPNLLHLLHLAAWELDGFNHE